MLVLENQSIIRNIPVLIFVSYLNLSNLFKILGKNYLIVEKMNLIVTTLILNNQCDNFIQQQIPKFQITKLNLRSFVMEIWPHVEMEMLKCVLEIFPDMLCYNIMLLNFIS